MSLLSRPRLILLEMALAACLVAYAFRGVWLPIGVAVALICAALALVQLRGRGLYQVLGSWLAMRSRRRQLRGQGVGSLVGEGHEVVSVPTAGAVAIGAIRDTSTWSVPLALPLVGLFNEDPPIPLDRIASLLTVEDVPLASVRLVTMTAPAIGAASAPGGPVPPAARLSTRHLVLTLDTLHAADSIAARGGEPAIHQILRRCVLRAEEVLSSAGVEVRRIPEQVVAMDSANCLGPLPPTADGDQDRAAESLDQVRLQDVVSATYTVSGSQALAQLDQLAARLPVPLVASSVLLQPSLRGRPPSITLLLRLSGPEPAVRSAGSLLGQAARATDLRVERVLGEQVPLLRATTLLGVTRRVAA